MPATYESVNFKRSTGLTARQRMILGWGKVRRLYLATLRPRYVRESLARRVGQCNRSGACCHLMFTCPILDRRSDPVRCRIHEVKPKICHLFPIDERDLRDRDIVSPGVPCGYSFIPRHQLQREGREAARHPDSGPPAAPSGQRPG